MYEYKNTPTSYGKLKKKIEEGKNMLEPSLLSNFFRAGIEIRNLFEKKKKKKVSNIFGAMKLRGLVALLTIDALI